MKSKACSCGSGQMRFALMDAANIFVAFVCDECEERVKARYNPNIFNPCSDYARSGEEYDIELY